MRRSVYLGIFISTLVFNNVFCQTSANVATIDASKIKFQINKLIYSHFSEHLGNCIYGGIWVGEKSSIPNKNGLRTDVVNALTRIKVPALRWPGGCFADEYHWMDGIGPHEKRPAMVNTNWGGVTENNSFGTHEFMELCNQLECEPYISGNLGSGTVQEMSQWVEYLNSGNISPMSDLRKANGREKPWGVKYWGLGNESWGCGGKMKPGYYADIARHYSTFLRNYGNNTLKKIAVGPNADDYNWTEVVMREMGKSYMWGLSLHYYTSSNTSATDFDESGWFDVMKKTLRMEELVTKHSTIMDQYDPSKGVALVVDEWGTWYNVEPGTNPAFLFQQNSLRDALVAGINLNIFNNHCDRVKMSAIAQVVNVLQSVILTKDDKMVLTPTYHVFDMYKVHQDAYQTPVTLSCGNYTFENASVPALNISSSVDKDGKMHISICNLNASKSEDLTCNFKGFKAATVTGQILSADKINAYNSFENPNNLMVNPFSQYKLNTGKIDVKMPPHSVVVLEVTGELEVTDKSVQVKNSKPGLKYSLYKGNWENLPEFKTLTPVKDGMTASLAIPEGITGVDYGLVISGYVKIEKNAMYHFSLASDDGSKLIIDGDEVILNDGRHGMIEQQGSIFLHKGFHPIHLQYFQAGGGAGLKVSIVGGGLSQQSLPEGMLWHEE